MDKSIDLDKPIFPTPLIPTPSVSHFEAGKETKIFKTLEEAFAAFDSEDESSKVEYIVRNTPLPPIPHSENVQNQLLQNALLLIDSGEYSLARNILNEILKKNGQCADAVRWMGWCFKQEEQFEEAKDLYESLIHLRISDQDLFELGEIYYALKNDSLAIETWLNALGCCGAESPSLFDLHKNLGNAFTRTGDYESAEENYNKALTLRSNSDVLQVNIGTLAFQRQSYLQAMSHFKQALQINAFNDKAWSGVALVAREMKDYQWARATLLRALDINPKNTTAKEILAVWDEQDALVAPNGD